MNSGTIIVLSTIGVLAAFLCVLCLIFAGNSATRKSRCTLVSVSAVFYMLSVSVLIGGSVSATYGGMDTGKVSGLGGFFAAVLLIIELVVGMIIISDSPKRH